MLRWLGPKKAPTTQQQRGPENMVDRTKDITDDPLAAIDLTGGAKKIYSVSRINPLYDDDGNPIPLSGRPIDSQLEKRHSRPKSFSSGYGGSHQESSQELLYSENLKFRDDSISILEQNEDYVKSIQVAYSKKSMPSRGSSSSATGILSAIPEGKIDCSIPSPVWPYERDSLNPNQVQEGLRDSLVDETLLLYTSFSYVPNGEEGTEPHKNISVKELLLELSNYVNETVESKNGANPEYVLKCIKEKIAASLDALKNCTEEEVKRLCINLSNKAKSNSVLRAFSNTSSSGNSTGNSSQNSPEWSGGRVRTYSSETEDIYHPPSASSSSGFSDANKQTDTPCSNRLSAFDEFVCDQNDLRNALIYATLYRTNFKLLSAGERVFDRNKRNWSANSNSSSNNSSPKKRLLQAAHDTKPSVWEQYYGVTITVPSSVSTTYVPKPTDVPLFPGGRPEADFTLDLPRSEFLNKKMREDKKWRCRCRLLTSFLGFVFFLLSVMAVSLILTRGKRMFGSMV